MSTDINLNKNIYNSDGTVNSNRTVDLDGNTINFDNGNVGINVTPSVPLHVMGTAIPSTNENLAYFQVTDGAGAYFAIQNGSTADGSFQPKIVGRQASSSNATAVTYAGVIDSTQDSGTTPVVGFQAHLHTLAPIVTRPLFQFRNWATNIMTILANGNVGIGTVTPSEKLEVSGKTKTTTFQMTTSPTAGYVLTSDASGNGTWSPASSGGLTYFTEAQNTAAPNATVPVDSLTAVSAATNADFAVIPKGNGALLVKIPDNAGTGGNKRGQYALDLQLATDFATRVASGNYSTIIGGQGNTASGTHSLASGGYSVASGNYSVALGASTSSSTYTLAVGQSSTASADGAVSLGRSNTSSGSRSFSSNYLSVASGTESVAMGNSCTAAGDYSIATGLESSTSTIRARRSHGNGSDSQASIFMLKRATTGNTLTYITTDGNDEFQGGATNMFLLVNNQAMRFKGTIIGKQSGSANVASWDIDGLVVRTTSAANTTLVVSNVNVVSNSPAWGTPTLTANTTRGGVSVSVTGASATNIKWTAVIETTEVIYA